ncbi:MAG TPA: glycoside hydrolase family 3 C-terminal domain-containing protein, partial [Lachnospiraceae bacterium]|nr:glycoside hydrolase family 3 C-terminal domain-containing protein [Lachnospiraceae bacterium]
IKGFAAGCDLSMPGGSAYMEEACVEAVRSGRLFEACVDASVERMLKLEKQCGIKIEDTPQADLPAGYALAKKIAAEGAVLLKNEDALLPLFNEEETAFIGYMAKEMRYQGSGSSRINPWKQKNMIQVCRNARFAMGCNADGSTSDALLTEVRRAATEAKYAVVFAGLPDSCESEGFDREHMRMPKGHIRMIEEAAKANENCIVVLLCGSVVELPWFERVKAVLYMGLSGEAGAEAAADLLFGRENPCGKLAETWPLTYGDCVSAPYYSGTRKDAQYREGLYAGYRYYETAGRPVRFPFGYGLSYTDFSYSDLKIEGTAVSCTVTNTGSRFGKEIVQLYIKPQAAGVYRPVRELKGFSKIALAPGESGEVHFLLDERSFAVWMDGWKVQDGSYQICIGKDCHTIVLSQETYVQGEQIAGQNVPAWYHAPAGSPSKEDFETLLGHAIVEKSLKKGEFTMDNTVCEMKAYSLIMKIMYKAIEKTVAKGFGKKADYTDPTFRMIMSSSADCSLTSMKISGGMNNHLLEGLLEMANGRFFKGVRLLLKK